MRIGIVTLSFNQASFLEEAIQSVRLSDSSRLDYIVVDPGSTDGSRDIISKYRQRFSSVVLEPDSGPADGLNKGFSACTSDIFGYLNADDRFRPDTLDFVLSYFEKYPTVDVLCGAVKIIDKHGSASVRKRTASIPNLRDVAAGVFPVFQQGTFFRKEAYRKTQGFNINNRTCWDGELVVDMMMTGCRFATVSKVLGDFRIHDESISGAQRLRKRYEEDFSGIQKKIKASGITLHSRMGTLVRRFKYKLDLKRHVSSLLVK